jgi:3-hydroxyisobutyryl-CoA hydrolase
MAMQCRRRAVWWLLQQQQRANHRSMTLSSVDDDDHLQRQQQQVLFEAKNGYSRLALLNRPSALNAINTSMVTHSLTHSSFNSHFFILKSYMLYPAN